MVNRISSALVFSLLKRAYRSGSDKAIYDILCLDQNSSGPRFREGHSEGKTSCNWPSRSFFNNINYDEYLNARKQYEEERMKRLASEKKLRTELGVWCFLALLKAYTTGLYLDNQEAAKRDIISCCRDCNINTRKINYYNKYSITVERICHDIIVECENSQNSPLVEADDQESPLILNEIRAFLGGQATDKGVVFKTFQSNEAFIQCLFPKNCIDDFNTLGLPNDVIVECSYDDEEARKIGDKFLHDNGLRSRKVVENCKRLYEDMDNADALYNGCISITEKRFTNNTSKALVLSCIRRCTDTCYPYRGFAVLVLVALLGEIQFRRVYKDEEGAHRLIQE